MVRPPTTMVATAAMIMRSSVMLCQSTGSLLTLFAVFAVISVITIHVDVSVNKDMPFSGSSTYTVAYVLHIVHLRTACRLTGDLYPSVMCSLYVPYICVPYTRSLYVCSSPYHCTIGSTGDMHGSVRRSQVDMIDAMTIRYWLQTKHGNG